MKKTMKKGFTLIEILIVVVLLGILAAIVIPQFTDASDAAKVSARDSDLQTLRGQVQLYKAQNGSYPATLGALAPTYMPSVPVNAVTGAAFTYDASTGSVTP